MSTVNNSLLRRGVGIVVVALLLSGCGQKGPLTLPQQGSLETPASTQSG